MPAGSRRSGAVAFPFTNLLKPPAKLFGQATPMASPSFLAQSSREAEALLARKQGYRRLIGTAFGAAGLAAALVGMPLEFSLALWGLGALAWAHLKAV